MLQATKTTTGNEICCTVPTICCVMLPLMTASPECPLHECENRTCEPWSRNLES